MQPQSHYLTCAGREIHFMEWAGPAPDAGTVIACSTSKNTTTLTRIIFAMNVVLSLVLFK